MKIIDIIRTASSNMATSKMRTFLTVVAVFIGALTLTLTNGIGSGISSYIDKQLGGLGAEDALIIQPQNDIIGTITGNSDAPKKYNPERKTTVGSFGNASQPVLTQKDIDKIKSHPELSQVEAFRAVNASYISGPNGEKYLATVSDFFEGTNLEMISGTNPDNSSSQPQIILPGNYVTSMGFASAEDVVGKIIKIGVATPSGGIVEVPATAAGVPEKNLLSQGGPLMNKALLNEMYTVQTRGLPASTLDSYVAATARFDKSLTSKQLIELKNKLKDQGYSAGTIQDQVGVIKNVLGGIVTVLNLFGIIALLAASFGVINTLLMAVQERTKEIGLMKAMGMSKRRIFALFSMEAILLGFWGSLLGVLVAMGIGQIANRVAANSFLKDFEGLNLLAFPVLSLIGIMVLIMAITFLAGTLPARRAAKLNPIEALRYE